MNSISFSPTSRECEEMNNRGFHTFVVLPLPGSILSAESQSFRELIEEWFITNDILDDVDVYYFYCDGLQNRSLGSYERLNSICFWFKDPNKAILFKLVFG